MAVIRTGTTAHRTATVAFLSTATTHWTTYRTSLADRSPGSGRNGRRPALCDLMPCPRTRMSRPRRRPRPHRPRSTGQALVAGPVVIEDPPAGAAGLLHDDQPVRLLDVGGLDVGVAE